jgi:hypothetical protein
VLHNCRCCFEKVIRRDENLKRAVKYYHLSVERGVLRTPYNSRCSSENGSFILEEAAASHKLSAEQGLPPASYNVGSRSENVEKADAYYKFSAEQGLPPENVEEVSHAGRV